MKNIEIIKTFNALTHDILQASTTVLPTVLLAAKMKNVRVLTPYVKDWEESKNELIKRFGTEQEDGSCRVEPSNTDFLEEFNKLNDMDHPELDEQFMRVNVEDLPKEMAPQEFELLSVMVNLD